MERRIARELIKATIISNVRAQHIVDFHRVYFDEWIKRMQTPQLRVDAIRDLFDGASEESSRYFSLQNDYSFSIDAALFEIRKV